MARIVCNFVSRVLQRTVDITVVIPTITVPESLFYTGGLKHKGVNFDPPKYKKYVGRPLYPVLYLLHGLGNNHAQWTAYARAELFAEERNLALVMISGENKSYVNHPYGDRFYDFIQDELMDFVCGMYPISQEPKDTFIAGLSMGGGGSMVHSLSSPEKFGGVGVLSIGIPVNNSTYNQCDIPTLIKQAKEKKTKLPPYYFAIGGKDYESEARYAADLFEDAGAKVTWHQLPDYAHEWRFWDIEVENLMDWLPRTDAYAELGKRRI